MQAALIARVNGVNLANHCANVYGPEIVKVFQKYLGEKIEKVDGKLLSKIQKEVDDLPKSEATIYRYGSDYNLIYCFKTCTTVNGHAYYHETSVYIGEIRNGVLTKINNLPHFKTDYRAEDVHAAREKYQKAKQVADAALNDLYPFGEYDR